LVPISGSMFCGRGAPVVAFFCLCVCCLACAVVSRPLSACVSGCACELCLSVCVWRARVSRSGCVLARVVCSFVPFVGRCGVGSVRSFLLVLMSLVSLCPRRRLMCRVCSVFRVDRMCSSAVVSLVCGCVAACCVCSRFCSRLVCAPWTWWSGLCLLLVSALFTADVGRCGCRWCSHPFVLRSALLGVHSPG